MSLSKSAKVVLLLTLIALSLSLWGGTSFHQVDSLIPRARKVLANGGDPGFFHYPTLAIYAVTVPYGLLELFLGQEALTEFAKESAQSIPQRFFSYSFPGHLVIALLGLLGVLSARAAVRSLFDGEWSALWTGVLVATSLLWVADSHLVTVDVPMAALVALTMALTLSRVVREEPVTLRWLALIGAAAGLAAGAKYNGALILFPATAALVWHAWKWKGNRWAALLLPGAVALATFLASSPFILIDFDTFWTDFQFEWRHAKLGHDGYETDNGLLFHLENSLAFGFGWIGLAVSGLGFVLCALSRRIPVAAKLVLLGFPILHYGLIGSSQLAFQRYMLPMIPFLAVGAGIAIEHLRSAIPRAPLGFAASAILALAILGPNLESVIRHNQLMALPDIRQEMILALNEARIDPEEMPVFCGDYGGRCLRGTNLPIDTKLQVLERFLSKNNVKIYLFDSFSHDRELTAKKQTRRVRNYREFEDFAVIRFNPFGQDKSEIPASPKSLYSPYLPDLALRRRTGPFLEAYFVSHEDADKLAAACESLAIEYERTTGRDAWYFNRLRERTIELAKKKKRENG